MEHKRKTVIIGGVAGGASCAARLRRLDAEREKMNALSDAMDRVRSKYGKTALSYARVLDNDIGFDFTSEDEDS